MKLRPRIISGGGGWFGSAEGVAVPEKIIEVPVTITKEVPVENVVVRTEVVTVERVVERIVPVEHTVEVPPHGAGGGRGEEWRCRNGARSESQRSAAGWGGVSRGSMAKKRDAL